MKTMTDANAHIYTESRKTVVGTRRCNRSEQRLDYFRNAPYSAGESVYERQPVKSAKVDAGMNPLCSSR